MYLTAGQFKGRNIVVPKSARPTLSKVRESVFNILNCFDFEDKKEITFFEMFTGSGIMGLEAISRGYKSKGVEIDKNAVKIIKQNYKNLGLSADIIQTDIFKYKTEEKFDIIYIDPPWQFDYIPVIKKAQSLIEKNGIIIIEYDKSININLESLIEDASLHLEIIKKKRYGRVLIDFLKSM